MSILIGSSEQFSHSKPRAWKIHLATQVLKQGGVIAHPTEAIWGLACDPLQASSIVKLLEMKHRPVDKGLILVSGHREHFHFLLDELSDTLKERFFAPQSSPTTWLVPDTKDKIPAYIKGKFSSVALRLTQYPLISELSKSMGHAIISTSANPAGMKPAANAFKVNQYFSGSIDYILNAPLGAFPRPSVIRDLVSNKVIRG